MEITGIYDSGPMRPVCRIKDSLAVYTDNKWKGFNVIYLEPIPRSTPFIIDLVLLNGATTIPANSPMNKQISVALQMTDNELFQVRWEALDDVDGMLWELSNAARFAVRGGQAHVDLWSDTYDPNLSTTTFFIMGNQKDAMIGAINPRPVAQPSARFAFWGFRYILDSTPDIHPSATYLPAQSLITN